MPHAFYRTTLHLFAQPRTLESYRAAVLSSPRIDPQEHEGLLAQFIKEGVLLPAACS